MSMEMLPDKRARLENFEESYNTEQDECTVDDIQMTEERLDYITDYIKEAIARQAQAIEEEKLLIQELQEQRERETKEESRCRVMLFSMLQLFANMNNLNLNNPTDQMQTYVQSMALLM